jgi:hypothetical protein
MKILILSAMIALSAYAYSQSPETEAWKLIKVMNPDGSPSKYEVMRSSKAIIIHANHEMGNGSLRYTIIEDTNGDYVVDRAYLAGGLEPDEKMYYNRQYGMGLKYYTEWQEEWNESVHRIEKLLGKTLR